MGAMGMARVLWVPWARNCSGLFPLVQAVPACGRLSYPWKPFLSLCACFLATGCVLRRLVGVPVITVQLRYDGWVTEMKEMDKVGAQCSFMGPRFGGVLL